MANSILVFDSTGILSPSTEDSLEEVQNLFKEKFGNSITTDPRSLAGFLQQTLAAERDSVVDAVVLVLNQQNLDYAIGNVLDAKAFEFGLKRSAGTGGYADLVINGTPSGTQTSIILPNGFAFVDDNNRSFVLGSALTVMKSIPAGARVTEIFPSSGPIPKNSITEVAEQPAGWTITATNPAAGIVGSGIETDAALRRRIRVQRTALSPLGEIGVAGRVNNVKNVVQAQQFSNPASSPNTISGVLIPANSILLVVRAFDGLPLVPSDPYCGLPEAAAIEIAKAANGALGGGMMRWTVGDLTNHTVTVSYPIREAADNHTGLSLPAPNLSSHHSQSRHRGDRPT